MISPDTGAVSAAVGTAESRFYALVPAAGVGARSGASQPKQYVTLVDRPMLAHTVDALAAVPELHATLVVLASDDDSFTVSMPAASAAACWQAYCGGASRAESVAAGLEALLARGAREHDWVLVHDAARCLLRAEAVQALIAGCRGDAVGGLLALPVADTLKQSTPEGRIATTVDRRGKWAAQTPQMFRLGLLREALARPGAEITDEASAIEALGLQPKLVEGTMENFKVTWPADFELAERLLRSR
ncbi:2-C-methyl-D-erythritol 4-phosphate cytidylyltransferase [Paucibacter sp. APW11]|uniref:2-C-methyl-D-erythritol 4-phosphate cytidylyltransferase n=1 Tax=Roseateles aquae TaxID=3077235 RepID=A0ABU3PAU4_9BURK|nr:2-C-methyl-D-erythritol 4-phosphate cytidylyltransferase [Paucibacter sp. APW11]MDT8999218.1 2-C-methyl-D-erythritol 4-phosphate cytidylyltransferase [Paucibacter sp. APW11]